MLEQVLDAITAQAAEGSARVQLLAVVPADLGHWTLPTAAVADAVAQPAGAFLFSHDPRAPWEALIVIRVISARPGNNCIDANFPRCIACEGEVGRHRMGPPAMRESLFKTMAEETMAPDFHLDEASRWMAESQFVHWCLV